MSDKMTATETLRQLLDERGVEWEEPDPYQDATAWVGSRNIEYVAHEGITFDGPTGRLILFCLTPEQAVEATLGPAVPPPEPPVVPYDLLIDELRDTWGIEACWDGLRKFWYLGWTDEHVEDMGRLHDELCDAVAEASTVKAHRILDKARYAGRGTCKVVSKPCDMWECECGKAWWHGGAPNYCPSCGRRVVE